MVHWYKSLLQNFFLYHFYQVSDISFLPYTYTHLSIPVSRQIKSSLLQHPTTFITETGAPSSTIHALGQALTGVSLPYRREGSCLGHHLARRPSSFPLPPVRR